MNCYRCKTWPCQCGDGITLIHGDCREVLPLLPKVDLVLTDPPYGINHPTNYASRGRSTKGKPKDYAPVYGDNAKFTTDHILSLDVPSAIWGANYFASDVPPSSSWLVWDKRVQQGVGVNDQADGELAWCNFTKGVRIFRHMWNGMWRDSERGEAYHPTQKPVALMRWVLSTKWTPPGTVCDLYAGSGPVLVAAKQLGRRAIGIEIEEKYVQIAANRLRQEVLQFKD